MKSARETRWGGLAVHFVALSMVLTLATSAAVAAVLTHAVDRQVESAADNQLSTAAERFRDELRLERDTLTLVGTTLASRERLHTALNQRRLDIAGGMLALAARPPVDTVLVADSSGDVLVWTAGAQGKARPAKIERNDAFRRALAGETSSRAAVSPEGYIVVEVYVPLPEVEPPAVIQLADFIDQREVDAFVAEAGTDVSVFVGGSRIVSTFRNSDGSPLDAPADESLTRALAAGQQEAFGWRSLPTGRVRTRYGPLFEVEGGQQAILATAVRSESLLGDFRDALAPTMPVVLIIMLLGGGLTYLLSRRMSEPILLLAGAAARMQHGDLDTPLPRVGEPTFRVLRDELESARAQLEAAQRALRESDERHRDLVENIPHMVCVHDLDGRVLYVNPAGEQLTGYDRLALLSMNLRDLVPADFRDEVTTYLEGVRKDGSGDGLMRLLTRSGERRILQYSCNVRHDSAAGGPVVRGIGYDMTERFQWMELQKALFAGVREPILATSPDDRIVMSNAAAEDFFGDQDLYGRDVREVLPLLREECEWLPDGLLWQGRLTRGDRSLDVQVTAGLLHDPSLPIRAVYIIHDVSRQAELSRQREQLLHNVAHELRNPISIIENTLSLASSDLSELSMRDLSTMLRTAYRTATRLHDLTEDLLSAGNIQAGTFQVSPKPVALSRLLENAAESVQAAIDAAGQRLVVELPEAGVTVLADEPYANRALTNLLTNASKYGPPRSTITTRAELDSDYVKISVTDEGPGIPEHEQRGLFERFYRGRPGRDQPGVGLGLAIVKGLVEAHGGKIGVDSAPGQGTTFWFTLPVAVAETAVPV